MNKNVFPIKFPHKFLSAEQEKEILRKRAEKAKLTKQKGA